MVDNLWLDSVLTCERRRLVNACAR